MVVDKEEVGGVRISFMDCSYSQALLDSLTLQTWNQDAWVRFSYEMFHDNVFSCISSTFQNFRTPFRDFCARFSTVPPVQRTHVFGAKQAMLKSRKIHKIS